MENIDTSIIEEYKHELFPNTIHPSEINENQINEETHPKQLLIASTPDQQNTSHDTTSDNDLSRVTEKPDTQVNSKSKGSADAQKTGCTQLCNIIPNIHMIQCSKCEMWTHYECTKLPIYQLYLLTSTKRRYDCEKCTTVPESFKQKWQNDYHDDITVRKTEHETSNDTCSAESDKTMKILQRIENSVVEAITQTHAKAQDEIINQLKSDIQREQYFNKQMTEVNGKLEEINQVKTQVEQIRSETSVKITEGYEKMSTKTSNQIKDFTDKLGNKLITAVQSEIAGPVAVALKAMSESTELLTKSMDKTDAELHDNTKTNKEISKTLENIAEQISKTESTRTKNAPRNSVDENYQPNVSVRNRFSPLIDDEQTPIKSPEIQSEKKILILGNSHIRDINNVNFLDQCRVYKYNSSSISEMENKLDELETDLSCIFFHVFTNDIRNNSPDKFVEKLDTFCQKLQDQCPHAKLIVSLPFLTVRNWRLNEKISKCNILAQHNFMKSTNVHINVCDNSVFYYRNKAIVHFFKADGLHLEDEGIRMFVSNIKYWVRKVLKLQVQKSQNVHVEKDYRKQSVRSTQNNYDRNESVEFDPRPHWDNAYESRGFGFEARPPWGNRYNSFQRDRYYK